jgi:hypothetical protein
MSDGLSAFDEIAMNQQQQQRQQEEEARPQSPLVIPVKDG